MLKKNVDKNTKLSKSVFVRKVSKLINVSVLNAILFWKWAWVVISRDHFCCVPRFKRLFCTASSFVDHGCVWKSMTCSGVHAWFAMLESLAHFIVFRTCFLIPPGFERSSSLANITPWKRSTGNFVDYKIVPSPLSPFSLNFSHHLPPPPNTHTHQKLRRVPPPPGKKRVHYLGWSLQYPIGRMGYEKLSFR